MDQELPIGYLTPVFVDQDLPIGYLTPVFVNQDLPMGHIFNLPTLSVMSCISLVIFFFEFCMKKKTTLGKVKFSLHFILATFKAKTSS